MWLLGFWALAWGLTAIAQEKTPPSEIGQDQPNPPGEPPAMIEGFRQARFGMSEEQVRQAIRKDFPAAAAKIVSAVHPSEKTTVLSISVADLLPNTGTARVSYIFGYRSKKLIQINVVWTSDGSAASDETIVATANSLRDYFALQTYKPDSAIANRQIADNTIIVFRANDGAVGAERRRCGRPQRGEEGAPAAAALAQAVLHPRRCASRHLPDCQRPVLSLPSGA
jgi:hypothetical protein